MTDSLSQPSLDSLQSQPQFSVPPRKFSFVPVILGFFFILFLVSAIIFIYFQSNFKTLDQNIEPSSTPTPSPSPIISASPSASIKASSKPLASPRPSLTPSPIPAVKPQPSLDIRFGNPSVNIKQTIDEGQGDGRVINREYTSIQAGQFDEVSSTWSPRVTVCYHLVTNEEIAGKDLKFTFTLDDKVEVEDYLGQYDKLEIGRLYDWCHDVTTSIGKHTAKLEINSNKSHKEFNYFNNIARVDWENLPDKIAPNFTLTGPTQNDSKTCLSLAYLSDNVTKTSDLKIEEKYDDGAWTLTTATTYCASGTSGSQHTYAAKVTDARGNVNQQTKTFTLY